jgi:quercetin dioxygenase-like cupin family protein
MTSASATNGCVQADHAVLYALRALPADEAAAMEAHLAQCAACRREIEALRPTIDSFVAWPTDVLRPPSSLWGRVAERISAETGGEPVPDAPQEWHEPEWEEVAPGISCKLLATDHVRNMVSMLVRLAPGTEYPAHRHMGVEELHLLDGVLIVDDRTLYAGDYIHAQPGSADARVWSETGCTCVLITSTRDELR